LTGKLERVSQSTQYLTQWLTYLIDSLHKTEMRRERLVINWSTIQSRDIQYCSISEHEE